MKKKVKKIKGTYHFSKYLICFLSSNVISLMTLANQMFYVQAHAYIYKCKKDGGIETDKTTYTKAIYTR